jgi:hypothetical protein
VSTEEANIINDKLFPSEIKSVGNMIVSLSEESKREMRQLFFHEITDQGCDQIGQYRQMNDKKIKAYKLWPSGKIEIFPVADELSGRSFFYNVKTGDLLYGKVLAEPTK